MKDLSRIFFIFVVLLVGTLAVNQVSAAGFGLTRPFGGKIFSTTTPGVTCPVGTGPVTLRPVGTFPAASYFFQYSIHGIPLSGEWVLGNYSAVPSVSDCATDSGEPVPVLHVTLYGLSSF